MQAASGKSAVSDKSVAVITDSLSAEFYFPLWYRYYAEQFGSENLFVVTYRGLQMQFYNKNLGGIWELHNQYDDTARALTISALVSTLLETYNVVIRVDTDEFLIADPRSFGGLREYVVRLERPYVTAMGLDVIQDEDEPDLDLTQDILVSQRKYGYRFSAVNKTCVTSIPLRWLRGFHACSVFPEFANLFLIHLKRADLRQQVSWSNYMATKVNNADTKIVDYYAKDHEQLKGYSRTVRAYPRKSGWEGLVGGPYDAHFRAGVRYYATRLGGHAFDSYHPQKPVQEQFLRQIPEEFRGKL